MPPPTNTSAATATAITTLPASLSVDLTAVTPGALSLWWVYTAVPGDVVASVWLTIGGAADGELTVWVGPVDALVVHLDIEAVSNVQEVPLTPGTPYYLEVALVAGAATPLVVSVLPGPTAAVPAGTLLINDDAEGFPATFLSAVDGTSLRYRPLPAAGENAAMLRTGVSLWEEAGAPTVLRLYTPTFTLAASPAVPGRVGTAPIGSNRATRFYAAVGTVVTTVDLDGTVGAQTWDLGGSSVLQAIEPSPDDTVLYYVRDEVTRPVKRWDLVADAALSDLAPTVPDYDAVSGFACEFLVLPDGSVIIPYKRVFVGLPWRHSFVRRYDASGAILHTYDLGTVDVNRIAYDWTDEAGAFWVWSFEINPLSGGRSGYSRIQSLRVSDGAVLRTFDTVLFSVGLSAVFAEPPVARFGHPHSCAFIALPVALDVVPAYTLDERHIRRLRRAPHVNHEHKRVFFRSFELDLERGQGLVTGQGIDPLITLRLSRDGGQTWGEPVPLHAGALGAYTQRVIARRLGVARDTVFEVTVSDPIAWSLVGAWLDLEPGTS